MNDKFYNFKIDWGSVVTIVNLKFIKSENIRIPINTLRYPTGEKVSVMFKTSVKIHIEKYFVDIIVFIGNITDDCIFGSDFLVPLHLQDEVDKLILEMTEQGIIEESSSSWYSTVVMKSKKDGFTRFCNDSRRLNAVTI